MNLVIDWGNTKIKTAFFDSTGLRHQYSFQTKDEVVHFLKGNDFEATLISSVNGNPNELANELPTTSKTVVLTRATLLPIKNQYATPNTLGMDRLAAACGAWGLFPNQPSLVIDLGSCINYEFVDAQGNYQGGAIAPGVTMRFKAMNQFTAKLPIIEPVLQPKWIGNNTEACMQSGVMNGVLAEIQGFIGNLKKQEPTCQVIVCGGDAHFFEAQIKDATFVAPLVLIGLNTILLHNLNLA